MNSNNTLSSLIMIVILMYKAYSSLKQGTPVQGLTPKLNIYHQRKQVINNTYI